MNHFARIARTLAVGAVVVAGLAPWLGHTQPIETLQAFDEANGLYEEGAFAAARDAYERVLATGYSSGVLYFHLGNTHFRLDEIGQAIRFYEKAYRLIPNDTALRHNLQVARARTADPSRLPPSFWVPWWYKLAGRTGTMDLFLLGLVGYVVASLLAGYRIWYRDTSPWLRRGLSVAVAASVIFVSAAFLSSLGNAVDRRTVVIVSQATVLQAPSVGASVEATVREGHILRVLQEREGWVHVRLGNGVSGWIDGANTASI
jgi:tetratricopeptide (TPR) repeat protein